MFSVNDFRFISRCREITENIKVQSTVKQVYNMKQHDEFVQLKITKRFTLSARHVQLTKGSKKVIIKCMAGCLWARTFSQSQTTTAFTYRGTYEGNEDQSRGLSITGNTHNSSQNATDIIPSLDSGNIRPILRVSEHHSSAGDSPQSITPWPQQTSFTLKHTVSSHVVSANHTKAWVRTNAKLNDLSDTLEPLNRALLKPLTDSVHFQQELITAKWRREDADVTINLLICHVNWQESNYPR